MPKTIQRTVAFYWLRLRSREAVSYRPVEDVDWESRLADLDSMKWQEKAIDGIRYDAILGKEYPILSVSEQFDPTFMQYIDRENERQKASISRREPVQGIGEHQHGASADHQHPCQ